MRRAETMTARWMLRARFGNQETEQGASAERSKSWSDHRSKSLNGQDRSRTTEMDTTTLLIIVLIVLLIGGGGWYGRGRWY